MVKTTSIKNIVSSLALAGLLLPVAAFAGADAKATKVVEASSQSAITGDIGINFTNQYTWRGILQEDRGLITQPYADLYFAVYEGSGLVNKVSLNLGIWSSTHSNTATQYEQDFSAGVSVTLDKNTTVTTSFVEYDVDGFDRYREVVLGLSYNDSDLLGAFALHPHVTSAHNISGNYPSAGDKDGTNYYEVGVAPVVGTFGPATVTVPVTAGFGNNGCYTHLDNASEESHFGYVSAGPAVSVALPVAKKFGAWSLTASALYYKLNGATAEANGGPAYDWVFSGGIGCAF